MRQAHLQVCMGCRAWFLSYLALCCSSASQGMRDEHLTVSLGTILLASDDKIYSLYPYNTGTLLQKHSMASLSMSLSTISDILYDGQVARPQHSRCHLSMVLIFRWPGMCTWA